MRVLVPAALDCNDNGKRGWAVLRGVTNPPMVVAFCWSRELAQEVFKALGGHSCAAGSVWLSPARLTGDRR